MKLIIEIDVDENMKKKFINMSLEERHEFLKQLSPPSPLTPQDINSCNVEIKDGGK